MLPSKLSGLLKLSTENEAGRANMYKDIEDTLKREGLTSKEKNRLVQCFKEDLKNGNVDEKTVLQTWASCATIAKSLSSALVVELYSGTWQKTLISELLSTLLVGQALNLEECFNEQNEMDAWYKIIEALVQVSSSVPLETLLNFIHLHTVRSIFQTNNNFAQTVLCTTVLRLTPNYGLQFCEKEIQRHVCDNFKHVYILAIEDLRKANNKIWYELCIFTLKYFGKMIHPEIEMLNNVLSNIEHGFKSKVPEDKISSFECWKAFIDISTLDRSYLCNIKQIALLIKPLKVELSRNDQVTCKRLEVWIHLLSTLQENCLACLEEFMNFCFEAQIPIIKSTWSRRTEVLMNIIGHCDPGECCIHPQTFKLNSPLINSANLLKYKSVVLNAITVCSENILVWEVKINIEKKIKCMWGSLFNIVGQLHNLDKELVLRDILVILQRFLKKSEEDQDYFDDIIQPVFNVISALEIQSCDYLIINEIIVFPIAQLMLNCSNIPEYRALTFIQLLRSCSKTGSRLDYLNRSCELLQSYTHNRTLLLPSYIWLEFANELLSICRSPKDEFETFKDSSMFLMCWISECRIPDNLKKMIVGKWSSIMTEIDVISDEFKESVLESFQKLLKDNPTMASNILEFLPTAIEKITEDSSLNYITQVTDTTLECLKNPCLTSNRVITVLPIISKISANISKTEANEYELLGLKLFECIEYFMKPHQVYETLRVFKSILPKLSISLKKRLPYKLRAIIDDLITHTDHIIAQDAISLVAELNKQEPVKTPIFPKPVVSNRTAKIASMTTKGICQDQSLNLFAQAVQKSPISVKGSVINNMNQRNSRIMKIANAMPSIKKQSNVNLDMNSSDFVYIDTEVKVVYDKMVSHQKEVLRRRKEDIPALYQDLSQSHHSSESLSKSNETVDLGHIKNDKNVENILDDTKESRNETIENISKDSRYETIQNISKNSSFSDPIKIIDGAEPQQKLGCVNIKSGEASYPKPQSMNNSKIIILKNEILQNRKDTKEVTKREKRRRYSDSQSLSQDLASTLSVKRSSSLESIDSSIDCQKSFKIVPMTADGENTPLKIKITITNEKNIKHENTQINDQSQKSVEVSLKTIDNQSVVRKQLDVNKIEEGDTLHKTTTKVEEGQEVWRACTDNNIEQINLMEEFLDNCPLKDRLDYKDVIERELSGSSDCSMVDKDQNIKKRKRKPRTSLLSLSKSNTGSFKRKSVHKLSDIKPNTLDTPNSVDKQQKPEEEKGSTLHKRSTVDPQDIDKGMNIDKLKNLEREENIQKQAEEQRDIDKEKLPGIQPSLENGIILDNQIPMDKEQIEEKGLVLEHILKELHKAGNQEQPDQQKQKKSLSDAFRRTQKPFKNKNKVLVIEDAYSNIKKSKDSKISNNNKQRKRPNKKNNTVTEGTKNDIDNTIKSYTEEQKREQQETRSPENQEIKICEINKENIANQESNTKNPDEKVNQNHEVVELPQVHSENIFETQQLIKPLDNNQSIEKLNTTDPDITICSTDLLISTQNDNSGTEALYLGKKKPQKIRQKISPLKKEISKLKMDIVGAHNFVGIRQKRPTSLRLTEIFNSLSNTKKRRSRVVKRDNVEKSKLMEKPEKNQKSNYIEMEAEPSQCLMTETPKKSIGNDNKNNLSSIASEIKPKNLSEEMDNIGFRISEVESQVKEAQESEKQLKEKLNCLLDSTSSILSIKSQNITDYKLVIPEEKHAEFINGMDKLKDKFDNKSNTANNYISVNDINNEISQLSQDSPLSVEHKNRSPILTFPKTDIENTTGTKPNCPLNNDNVPFTLEENVLFLQKRSRKRCREKSPTNLERVVRRSKRFEVSKNDEIKKELVSSNVETVDCLTTNSDEDIIESSQPSDMLGSRLCKSLLKTKANDTTLTVHDDSLSTNEMLKDAELYIDHKNGDYQSDTSIEIISDNIDDTVTCKPEESNLSIVVHEISAEEEPEKLINKTFADLDLDNLPTGLNVVDHKNLPGSPVSEDTMDRNSELFNSTVDISPIRNDPTLDQNCQDTELETPANFMKSPSSRSMMLMNLLPQNLKMNKSPKSVIKRTPVNAVGSPSTDRVRRMMMNCNGNNVHDNANVKDEQIDGLNVLEFTKEVPSPFATPSRSILKRKASEALECGMSPYPKRKRVNFSDPPTTAEKVYFKDQEDDFPSAPLELTKKKAAPIYPPLINCMVDIKEIFLDLKQESAYDSFSSVNIKTIGDLAKLTSTQVNQLEFLNNPKLSTVTTALSTFAERYNGNGKSDEQDISLVPNEDASLLVNGETENNALFVSALDKLKKSDEGISELWQELKALCTKQQLLFIYEDLEELFANE